MIKGAPEQQQQDATVTISRDKDLQQAQLKIEALELLTLKMPVRSWEWT